MIVKNTYTTNGRDANKLDDVDENVCVCCRVIIETRKREREKRIEREQCVRATTTTMTTATKKRKKRVPYFSLTANQLHDTTHKKNEETAALSIHPSIVFGCMLGCEVVREPTNRKKSFVKKGGERKRTTNEQ